MNPCRLALLLLAGIAAPVQDPPAPLTAERLRELVKECRPLVEKAAGKAFAEEPVAVLSTVEEVTDILAEELKPQVKILFAGKPDLDVALAAKGLAAMIASRVMGKFAFSTKKLYFIASHFTKLADELKMDRIRTPEFARAIVIHELVHAIDEQTYGLAALVAACKSSEEIEVANALIEGHAQFVSQAVLKARGEEELFRDLDRAITSPPASGEGEKFLAEMQNHAARFAYGNGLDFFTGLSKSGRAGFVDDVFKSPPKSKSVILHPETYFQPAKERRAAVDMEPFFEELSKSETPEGWIGRVVKLDEAAFRAACGSFADPKKVDEACGEFLGGRVYVRSKPNGSVVALAIMEAWDPDGAGRLMDLNMAVSKAKDERMKEGNLRIAESKVVDFKTEHADRVHCVQKTVVHGEQKIPVKSWMLLRGRFCIEALYSNTEVTDADANALFKKVADHLKTVK